MGRENVSDANIKDMLPSCTPISPKTIPMIMKLMYMYTVGSEHPEPEPEPDPDMAFK
jgi:hypothetical protein